MQSRALVAAYKEVFLQPCKEADWQSWNEPGTSPCLVAQCLGSSLRQQGRRAGCWRSSVSREEPPLQGFFCSLLILTCSSLPGEGENPRGSPAHASHFPGRREHLHHRLQPHERAAAGPVEPGTSPARIPGLLTSMPCSCQPSPAAVELWNGLAWMGH